MTELKQYTLREVSEHNTNKMAWLVIGNLVYDVTNFLDEHPGGCEVLLEQAGGDGTEAFEDVGHSKDARQMKDEYLIGEVVAEERRTYSYDKKAWKSASSDNQQRSDSSQTDNLVYFGIFAVIVGLVYYLLLN